MKSVERSLPYPMLSPLRDDVMPNKFALRCSCGSDSRRYTMSYDFEHEHGGLADMITSGAAVYAVHVEGRSCFYRVLYASCKPSGRIEIDVDDVAGTVEVTGFILARKASSSYTVKGSHPDYDKTCFTIRPGDVLACSETFTFEAEKEFDPLKKLSSIMQILPNEAGAEGPFVLDLDTDKITIFLSNHDYGLYGQARHDRRLASVLIQGIVLPALADAIEDAGRRLRNEDSLPKWAQVVRQRLAAFQVNLSEVGEEGLKHAQMLLRDPTHRFLTDLLSITEGESNEPQISD